MPIELNGCHLNNTDRNKINKGVSEIVKYIIPGNVELSQSKIQSAICMAAIEGVCLGLDIPMEIMLDSLRKDFLF